MQTILENEREKTQGGNRRRDLEEAAAGIVATMPRMFKTVMRHARDHETPESALTPDLGLAQMWTLKALTHGSQMMSVLARRFEVTNPTMTRVVDGLVKKGYVERQPDPEDRRCIYLHLTPAGAKMGDCVHERFQAALVHFLSPLSESQLQEIARAFAHLRGLMADE